jgi:hypothetical protein
MMSELNSLRSWNIVPKLWLLVSTAILLVPSGCEQITFVGQCVTGLVTPRAVYNIGWLDVEPGTYLDEVYAFASGSNVAISGAGSLYGGGGTKAGVLFQAPFRVPDVAVIHWRTSDKVEHLQSVFLARTVLNPWYFRGVIWLRFRNGSWDVVPVSDALAPPPH